MLRRRIVVFLLVVVLLSIFSISTQFATAKTQPQSSADIQSPSGGTGTYYLGDPDYDSNWTYLSGSSRVDDTPFDFVHNLGGNVEQYYVQLDCWELDPIELGHNDCVTSNFNKVAHWFGLTSTQVSVWVRAGTIPDFIRVRIWRLNPDADSGWISTTTVGDPSKHNRTKSFPHNLTPYDPRELIYLTCDDDSELGVHDCTNHSFDTKAHWYEFGSPNIKVYISGLSRPASIRVQMYKILPKYYSGWITHGSLVEPVAFERTHNLGLPVHRMNYRVICSTTDPLYVYDCTDQSFATDVYWFALTNDAISAFMDDGTNPPQLIRMMIYDQDLIYLPIVSENH